MDFSRACDSRRRWSQIEPAADKTEGIFARITASTNMTASRPTPRQNGRTDRRAAGFNPWAKVSHGRASSSFVGQAALRVLNRHKPVIVQDRQGCLSYEITTR